MTCANKQTWHDDMPACLDVCIPFFKDDPVALITQLSRQDGAEQCRISICDDGSGLPDLTARVALALERHPGPAILHILPENTGRANARNVMLADVRSDWVLMLDADMALDRPDFMATYQAAAEQYGEPCCIVGGFQVDAADVTSETALHAAQSMKSECRPAHQRARDPGSLCLQFFGICAQVHHNTAFVRSTFSSLGLGRRGMGLAHRAGQPDPSYRQSGASPRAGTRQHPYSEICGISR